MANKIKKIINDPVHGNIALNEVEIEIIGTRAFQRLRNIKQLGLESYVFPGADYSRFSHSIGVCHLTGQLLNYLRERDIGYDISDDDTKICRLAGLLHDIGHYPFSHTMEEAIKQKMEEEKDKKSEDILKKVGTEEPKRKAKDVNEYIKHDILGQEILKIDTEIKDILNSHGYRPEIISSLFTRDFTGSYAPSDLYYIFANIISSDLDVDRIDYLKRTSYFAGLPYGCVDINYLLSQTSIDKNQRICIYPKAMRTADHFLLSRYFDYAQITYHKTVAGFEEILKQVIIWMINNKQIGCSKKEILNYVKNGFWYDFDDAYLLNLFREELKKLYKNKQQNCIIIEKIQSILNRNPPIEIGRIEYFGNRKLTDHNQYWIRKDSISDIIPKLAQIYHIKKDYWFVWSIDPIELTKIGSSDIDFSISQKPGTGDKNRQCIRILNDPGLGSSSDSTEIIKLNNSLMSLLADKALYSIRLYLLIPDNARVDRKKMKEKISKTLKELIPDPYWK